MLFQYISDLLSFQKSNIIKYAVLNYCLFNANVAVRSLFSDFSVGVFRLRGCRESCGPNTICSRRSCERSAT